MLGVQIPPWAPNLYNGKVRKMQKLKSLFEKYEIYIHAMIFIAAVTLIIIGNQNPLVMALKGFVAGLSISDFLDCVRKKLRNE